MPDFFMVPSGCNLRPALAKDRWQIQRLLRHFDRERSRRSPTRFRWLSYILGSALIAMLIRAIVVTGPQVLLSLLVVLGLSLLVYWINFVLSEDWNKFWVIEVEGSVVACAKLCRYNTYSVLYNVMVAPEWRRYGLGSALVYHLSQVATKPLYLACYPKRITFYTKLGFVQIRPQDLSPLLRYDLGLTPRVDTVPLMFK